MFYRKNTFFTIGSLISDIFEHFIFRAEGALTLVSNRSLRKDFGRPV